MIEIGQKYQHNKAHEKVKILTNEGYKKFAQKFDDELLEVAQKLAKLVN